MPTFYIIDTFAGVIKYTDNEAIAKDIVCDDCYIIDTATNEQINEFGERIEITEHKML